jgi:hypothetical protein
MYTHIYINTYIYIYIYIYIVKLDYPDGLQVWDACAGPFRTHQAAHEAAGSQLRGASADLHALLPPREGNWYELLYSLANSGLCFEAGSQGAGR